MASINGVELKAVKNFRDHEGAPIAQGNVYCNGRKLGFWSQDSWGGPDNYDFDVNVLNDVVENYRRGVKLTDERYRDLINIDIMLSDLIMLKEKEKTYKDCVKRGFKYFVCFDNGYSFSGYYTKDKKESIPNSPYYSQYLTKFSEQPGFKGNIIVDIFGSLEDFNKVYR